MLGKSIPDNFGSYVFGYRVSNSKEIIPVVSHPPIPKTSKSYLSSILTHVNKAEDGALKGCNYLKDLPKLNSSQTLRLKYLEGFAERAEELRTAISAAKASLKTIVVIAVSAFLLKLAAPKLKDYIDSKSMDIR